MNLDPLAIRRTDKDKDGDALRAMRKEVPADSARPDSSILFKGPIRDLEVTVSAHWDPTPQQACDALVDRLRTGAV